MWYCLDLRDGAVTESWSYSKICELGRGWGARWDAAGQEGKQAGVEFAGCPEKNTLGKETPLVNAAGRSKQDTVTSTSDFSGGTGRQPSSSELTREWEVRKWSNGYLRLLGDSDLKGNKEKRMVEGRWGVQRDCAYFLKQVWFCVLLVSGHGHWNQDVC